MTLGFTGTQRGMTAEQRHKFRLLLIGLGPAELHHGDCVGADAEADTDAKSLSLVVHAHPPTENRLRAFCQPPTVVHVPQKYLARNRSIVAAGRDGLIAAPKDMQEPDYKRGQGTWTTVGYARQAGRRIWIVLPDGTVREE